MISKVWLAVGLAFVVAVGVIAFVAYGHSAPSGTAAQRLSGWVTSTQLGQDIGALQGDGRNVTRAVREHKGATAIRTVCAAMSNDVQTYNGELPSPDELVTQLLARAYGLDYDAAQACYRAGGTSPGLMAQSKRDRAKAAALFNRVLRRVRTVTDHPVPTTTTTVPGGTGTSLL